jgi:hypothetical protein
MNSEQASIATEEEIEGLGDREDTGWGDYPIDTVLIRTETRTVFDVVRRIEQGSFVMNPDFQRDFIWSDEKQSKLIESVLMRIPLPVFYLAEDQQGHMVVVDGLQRLSTFQRFFQNELRLKLPDQTNLHKKRFEDLSPKLQNRVEDCNLVLYIIDAKVPERARLDIFERVNGGVPLTRQQMRNCLYMGPATRFLKTESATEIFMKATGGSLRTSTMRDREFVNRFCAFRLLAITDYKGDMDDFLAAALRKMNKLRQDEIAGLSAAFRSCLGNNYKVFGKHAFRKHDAGQQGRSVLNASLWDVMSTGLANHSEQEVESRAADLRSAFYPLMNDSEFVDSITYSPNSTNKVRKRFEIATAMFKEVFGDNTN